MSQLAAEILVGITVIYLAIGLIFGLIFAAVGWNRVTASDATGTLAFRVVLIPGSALLWPWLLARWITRSWRAKIRIVNVDTLRRRALLFWIVLVPIAAVVLVAAILMRTDREASSATAASLKAEQTSGGNLREQ